MCRDLATHKGRIAALRPYIGGAKADLLDKHCDKGSCDNLWFVDECQSGRISAATMLDVMRPCLNQLDDMNRWQARSAVAEFISLSIELHIAGGWPDPLEFRLRDV